MSMISELIEKLIDNADLYTKELHDLMYEAADTIEMLSEKAREPKQGEWERIPYSFVGGFRCSCCGTKTLEKHWNFCPNCGARMEGAD